MSTMKRIPVTFDFSPSFIQELARFIERHPFVATRHRAAEFAFRYYMTMLQEAGGVTDARGFPVLARGNGRKKA